MTTPAHEYEVCPWKTALSDTKIYALIIGNFSVVLLTTCTYMCYMGYLEAILQIVRCECWSKISLSSHLIVELPQDWRMRSFPPGATKWICWRSALLTDANRWTRCWVVQESGPHFLIPSAYDPLNEQGLLYGCNFSIVANVSTTLSAIRHEGTHTDPCFRCRHHRILRTSPRKFPLTEDAISKPVPAIMQACKLEQKEQKDSVLLHADFPPSDMSFKAYHSKRHSSPHC